MVDRHHLAVVIRRQVPNLQRRHVLPRQGEGGFSALGAHLNKCNLTPCGCKGRRALHEHMVDGLDQRSAGSVVAGERVAGVGIEGDGIGAGCEVGAQISTAKTVNRLLGVTNHHQGIVGRTYLGCINAMQCAVLPRVGVLKFIHQGHRVLLPNGCGQTLVIGHDSMVQVLQQIRKIKRGTLLFGRAVGKPYCVGSMFGDQGQGVDGRGAGLHMFLYACKKRVLIRSLPFFVLQRLCAKS